MMKIHKSHETRFSDSSFYDFVCVNCGYTDEVPGGAGKLARPCKKPVGKGGITADQWYKDQKRKHAKWLKRFEE